MLHLQPVEKAPPQYASDLVVVARDFVEEATAGLAHLLKLRADGCVNGNAKTARAASLGAANMQGATLPINGRSGQPGVTEAQPCSDGDMEGESHPVGFGRQCAADDFFLLGCDLRLLDRGFPHQAEAYEWVLACVAPADGLAHEEGQQFQLADAGIFADTLFAFFFDRSRAPWEVAESILPREGRRAPDPLLIEPLSDAQPLPAVNLGSEPPAGIPAQQIPVDPSPALTPSNLGSLLQEHRLDGMQLPPDLRRPRGIVLADLGLDVTPPLTRPTGILNPNERRPLACVAAQGHAAL